MTRTTEPKFSKLTPKQYKDIGNHLDTVCIMIDGIAVYEDGVSDETVAKKFEVRPVLVANLRRATIGNIKKVKAQKERMPTPKEYWDGVDWLINRIGAIEKRLTAVEQQPHLPLGSGGKST